MRGFDNNGGIVIEYLIRLTSVVMLYMYCDDALVTSVCCNITHVLEYNTFVGHRSRLNNTRVTKQCSKHHITCQSVTIVTRHQ